MEWLEIVGLVLSVATSSVAATFITHGLIERREGKKAKKAVGYLALRLAVVFEKYAEDATEVVGGIGDFWSSSGHAGSATTSLPKLQPFPSDEEQWRELDIELTNKVLAFPERIRNAQGRIAFAEPSQDDEERIGETHKQAIHLAESAYKLAAELRQKNELPPHPTEGYWPEYLRGEIQALEERERTLRLRAAGGPPAIGRWSGG